MAEILISEAAAERLHEVVEAPDRAGLSVRVYVDHQCHCGGLRYGMTLGRPVAGDEQAEYGGVPFAVEPAVAEQPGTASIDYVQSPLQSGFTLVNSEHQCGGMH